MDRRTLQVLGALIFIVPVLWGAGAALINAYSLWITTKSQIELRLDRLERYRCVMGNNPPETRNWRRKPSLTEPGECVLRAEDRAEGQ